MQVKPSPKPSVVEVKAILERPKLAVRRMNWIDKNRGRNATPWQTWRTALEHEDDEALGLILIAQWRGNLGPVLPKWNCGIFLFEHRIYALDYEPDLPHTNTTGAGRPLHTRRLDPPNVHEHTWSQDG